MGGERYKFIYLNKAVDLTEQQKAAYRTLVPELVKIVNSFDLSWPNQPSDKEVVRLRIPKTHYERDDLVITKELADMHKLGWQDRSYGSDIDPAKEVAEKVMSAVMKSECRACFRLDEEDCVAQDLGYYEPYDDDRYDDEPWAPDYTACDKECGYCGRCPYD